MTYSFLGAIVVGISVTALAEIADQSAKAETRETASSDLNAPANIPVESSNYDFSMNWADAGSVRHWLNTHRAA
jgi:hypothetical protein